MEGSASERERERHERDAAHEVIDSDEGLCIFAGNEELKERPGMSQVTRSGSSADGKIDHMRLDLTGYKEYGLHGVVVLTPFFLLFLCTH